MQDKMRSEYYSKPIYVMKSFLNFRAERHPKISKILEIGKAFYLSKTKKTIVLIYFKLTL